MSSPLHGTKESEPELITSQETARSAQRDPRRILDCDERIICGDALWAPGGIVSVRTCPRIQLSGDNDDEMEHDDGTNGPKSQSDGNDTFAETSLQHPVDWAAGSSYHPPPVTEDINQRPYATLDLSDWGPESMPSHVQNPPFEGHPKTHLQSDDYSYTHSVQSQTKPLATTTVSMKAPNTASIEVASRVEHCDTDDSEFSDALSEKALEELRAATQHASGSGSMDTRPAQKEKRRTRGVKYPVSKRETERLGTFYDGVPPVRKAAQRAAGGATRA